MAPYARFRLACRHALIYLLLWPFSNGDSWAEIRETVLLFAQLNMWIAVRSMVYINPQEKVAYCTFGLLVNFYVALWVVASLYGIWSGKDVAWVVQ